MRTATIRTEVSEPETVAAAIRPDNTDAMHTEVVESDGTTQIITTIYRETTGGLRSTVDDYVVNLSVATELVQLTNEHTTTTHE